jgi:hypothetical protein
MISGLRKPIAIQAAISFNMVALAPRFSRHARREERITRRRDSTSISSSPDDGD